MTSFCLEETGMKNNFCLAFSLGHSITKTVFLPLKTNWKIHVCLFMCSSNTSKISRNSRISWDDAGLHGYAQKHVMPCPGCRSHPEHYIYIYIYLKSNQCHIMSPLHDHLSSCLQVSCINIWPFHADPTNQSLFMNWSLVQCFQQSTCPPESCVKKSSQMPGVLTPNAKETKSLSKTSQTIPNCTTSPQNKNSTWHVIIFHKSIKYNSVFGGYFWCNKPLISAFLV